VVLTEIPIITIDLHKTITKSVPKSENDYYTPVITYIFSFFFNIV
jgi:hypothetical protein